MYLPKLGSDHRGGSRNLFWGSNQVFQSKVEGESRIEGAKRPRIGGKARVDGAKRLRIEGEARTEGEAREKLGGGLGSVSLSPENFSNQIKLEAIQFVILVHIWGKRFKYLMYGNCLILQKCKTCSISLKIKEIFKFQIKLEAIQFVILVHIWGKRFKYLMYGNCLILQKCKTCSISLKIKVKHFCTTFLISGCTVDTNLILLLIFTFFRSRISKMCIINMNIIVINDVTLTVDLRTWGHIHLLCDLAQLWLFASYKLDLSVDSNISDVESSPSSFILKRPSFHAQLGLDVPPEMKPLHISLNISIQGANQAPSYHPSHTHSKSSSLYLHISPLPPPHFYRPTLNHPHSYVPHAQKTPQSTPPHHLIHALYTQKTAQIHTVFPILRRHSAHPSHHHPFRSLQTLQTRPLHRPGLRPIFQCTLDTYIFLYIFPFMRYDAPLAVRIGDNSLNFAQAHLTLALAASSIPPPAPSVSPK